MLALVIPLLLAVGIAHDAQAAGNASAAAGFLEAAQNSDGGFGAKKGQKSDPTASAWATVALLAAGKNPRDEFLKNGRSADQYLVAQRGKLTSLEQLGLLTMVQHGGKFGASRYGDPAAKILQLLSADAVRRDPRGASIAALGLLAAGTDQARQGAAATAQALLDSRTSDGAWGPTGNADSISTALALQVLAATRAATADHPAVKSGFAYLKAAQINDGAIAVSTRVDKATAGGSVTATAFTSQAFTAFRLASFRTELGKTVRHGLIDYQQRTTGGLTSKGSAYSQVPPSVVETAQAYPAFNGNSFPLRQVASVTKGPDAPRKKGKEQSQKDGEGKDTSSNRVSSGSGSDGISGQSGGGESTDPGAFQQAAAGSAGATAGKAASDEQDRAGQPDPTGEAAKKAKDAAGGEGGDEVSGTVVGAESAPALKTKAGALDDGLSNEQRATIALVVLLVAMTVAGVLFERMRPRPEDAPPLVYAAAAATGAALRPAAHGAWRAAGFTARDAATGRLFTARRRWPLAAVGLVGVALVAFPFATGMFDKAPKGAAMVDAFQPYMEQQRLASFERDFGQVKAYADETSDVAPGLLLPDVADPERRRAEFLERSPQVALFAEQWPAVDETLGGMLATIRANKGNYDAVAALPSFRLFPWFFVIPGVLLILLAAGGLVFARRGPRSWIPIRRATVALGVGLLLAPVAFQMFDRAPKGAAMVDAFESIETRQLVQDVQGHFGTIAVGQGAITAELFPALEAGGLSAKQVAERLPAADVMRERWVPILNNLTPMIGVMSDNVANYQAVAAMPPFGVFPWLFVLAGLATLGFALLAGRVPTSAPPAKRPPDPLSTNLEGESPMHLEPSRPTAGAVAMALAVAVTLVGAVPASAAKKTLTGTFQIAPGKSVKKGAGFKVTGSYFRMVYPNGNPKKGPFFLNTDSASLDKSYTLFKPGIDKGLRGGSFQEQPTPAFAPNGFALANRIVKPLPFAGIKFSLSTGPTDLQGGLKVGPPKFVADGRRLTADLRGFTASWNKIYFNQGSPKPNGKLVGSTRKATGTYDTKTKKYSITWVSQIVGGPFNDFAGYWHFEGKFKPAAKKK